MKLLTGVLAFLTLTAAASAQERSVLVYTRNHVTQGSGYVHDNIAVSVAAIRKLGVESGFAVDSSDDPAVFTDANLRKYGVLIFSNSNNEAFQNDAQRDAFRAFLKRGGGFVGIHSASGSEREWPYYWSVLGGKFLRHPRMQKFTVRVADPNHLATKDLPAMFEWEDECYFLEFLNPDLHPLLVTDPKALDDPGRTKHPADLVGNAMPLSWCLNVDGHRTFYTALGHRKEHYSNPLFLRHLRGGIVWAMGDSSNLDVKAK